MYENDDMAEFVSDSGSYLESLIRCRKMLGDSLLLPKLDEVLEVEIRLALLAANKAESEILRKVASVTPLKGV